MTADAVLPRARAGTDAALVDQLAERASAGDREAFAELVLATSPQLFELARKLVGNEHDASDVLQETYLRAFRSIARYRGDAAVTTWLYRICANCASTHLRRRRWSRLAQVEEALGLADPHAERRVADAGDASLARDRLQAALARLPDRQRAVVVLRDVYDLPHEAIAKELGISRGAAKVRLHRARLALRELLPPPVERGAVRRAADSSRQRPQREQPSRRQRSAGRVPGRDDSAPSSEGEDRAVGL